MNELQLGAPAAPSRVRLVRPGLYRSEVTGSLAPDVRDFLVGLATVADDEGWLIWRPAEIAAGLYPYTAPGRRLKDLERRSSKLVDVQLLVLKECGCALIPTLKAQHATKGGEQNTSIWAWHQAHAVGLRSATDYSVPSSVSDSDSDSDSSSFSVKGSSSSGARATNGKPTEMTVLPEPAEICEKCHRPTSVHAVTCSEAPHLRATTVPLSATRVTTAK